MHYADASPLRDSPIAASQMPLQGQCTHSGATSTWVGILDRFSRRLNAPCVDRWWESGKFGIQTLQSLTITGCSNNWLPTTQKTIPTTSVQDLDPRPCTDNVHAPVLPLEMTSIEPGENPTRTLTWKPLTFLSHIKRRTNDDRFPLSLWETWFCSSLGVPIPSLIGPSQPVVCM